MPGTNSPYPGYSPEISDDDWEAQKLAEQAHVPGIAALAPNGIPWKQWRASENVEDRRDTTRDRDLTDGRRGQFDGSFYDASGRRWLPDGGLAKPRQSTEDLSPEQAEKDATDAIKKVGLDRAGPTDFAGNGGGGGPQGFYSSARDIQSEIVSYAKQHGLDPAYALAVAARESSFNPRAHASKTIEGLFQMSGAERNRLGIPSTDDVGTQVEGFSRYTNELKDDMARRLGRDPTPSELYLGHYWGPGRAAGVINGRYAGYTARDVFTPRELAENPNLKPDRPVGELADDIRNDMDRRYAKYGGQGGTKVDDPSLYLTPSGDTASDTTATAAAPGANAEDKRAALALNVGPKAAPIAPSAPAPAGPTPSSDAAALTSAALNDTGGGKAALGDDLADLAKNLGGAMSRTGAPPPPKPNSDADLLQQMALAQQAQTPVEGLPSLPGQQAQGSSSLPSSSQRAPSYLDPRMFGIQPTQQG